VTGIVLEELGGGAGNRLSAKGPKRASEQGRLVETIRQGYLATLGGLRVRRALRAVQGHIDFSLFQVIIVSDSGNAEGS
jgi:hypothetical protein